MSDRSFRYSVSLKSKYTDTTRSWKEKSREDGLPSGRYDWRSLVSMVVSICHTSVLTATTIATTLKFPLRPCIDGEEHEPGEPAEQSRKKNYRFSESVFRSRSPRRDIAKKVRSRGKEAFDKLRESSYNFTARLILSEDASLFSSLASLAV